MPHSTKTKPYKGLVAIVLFGALLAAAAGGLFSRSAFAGHGTSPTLGAADSFAVLAATEITNVPTSDISGDVGLSPAAGSNYAGLTCAEVDGTIYTVNDAGPPCRVVAPGLLTGAQASNTAAFGALIAAGNGICDTPYGAVTKDL